MAAALMDVDIKHLILLSEFRRYLAESFTDVL